MQTTQQSPETAVTPAYRDRLTPAELRERAAALRELLRECRVCPHECGAHRLDGEPGTCSTREAISISSASPHFGEEPPLVGTRGSGTIFFASCNLRCLFCQNFEISHLRMGQEVSPDELAGLMLRLQSIGCHNINLVTPTHVTPQIVNALALATDRGLSLPLVYNCGGYESVETLRLLEDIVDVYMPDIKYAEDANALTYSGAGDYWRIVRDAVREMHRQVGNLHLDGSGTATRGLLIRHLVLPRRVAGTRAVLEFVAREISTDSYINIMDQYRPSYQASRFEEINRPITAEEYDDALRHAERLGLRRGFSTDNHLRLRASLQ